MRGGWIARDSSYDQIVDNGSKQRKVKVGIYLTKETVKEVEELYLKNKKNGSSRSAIYNNLINRGIIMYKKNIEELNSGDIII